MWTSDRRCPGGALTGVGSCRDIQKLQLSPLFFLDMRLRCSSHAFRSLKLITRLRLSGSLRAFCQTLSDRNQQIGDELSSAAGRRRGLAGRCCCWSHAASSAPLSDISEQSCLAGCLVRPTAVPTAALGRPAVFRPLQNYSALRLTWQSSLFSAARLKYLL